jgi:hypothetical protein
MPRHLPNDEPTLNSVDKLYLHLSNKRNSSNSNTEASRSSTRLSRANTVASNNRMLLRNQSIQHLLLGVTLRALHTKARRLINSNSNNSSSSSSNATMLAVHQGMIIDDLHDTSRVAGCVLIGNAATT